MDILVVAPMATHPITNGAQRRIVNLAQALKRRGLRPHLVAVPYGGIGDTAAEQMRGFWRSVTVVTPPKRLQKSGEVYGVDDWHFPAISEAVAQVFARGPIDAVIANYCFMTAFVEDLGVHVPVAVDTHDRLSDRVKLYKSMGVAPGFFYTDQENERAGLARADVLLAIQENEARYFTDLMPGKTVMTVGHPQSCRFGRRVSKLTRIGCVASAHLFNVQGLNEFFRQYRAYFDGLPGAPEAHLAGTAASIVDAQGKLVRLRGFVPDLDAFYEEMDLIACPIELGTGLKIKTVEALSSGAAVIATDTAMDGVPSDREEHQCFSVEAMMTDIHQLMTDDDALQELQRASRAAAAAYQVGVDDALDRLVGELRDRAKAAKALGRAALRRPAPSVETDPRPSDGDGTIDRPGGPPDLQPEGPETSERPSAAGPSFSRPSPRAGRVRVSAAPDRDGLRSVGAAKRATAQDEAETRGELLLARRPEIVETEVAGGAAETSVKAYSPEMPIGEWLAFGEGGARHFYADGGWSTPEPDHVWIEGTDAALAFTLAKGLRDLDLAFALELRLAPDIGAAGAHVILRLNGAVIYDAPGGAETMMLSALASAKLLNPDGVNRLEFATRRAGSAPGDDRALSICIYRLRLAPPAMEMDVHHSVRRDLPNVVFLSGWGPVEGGHVWINGREAELGFLNQPAPEATHLELAMQRLDGLPDDTSVEISLDGEPVYEGALEASYQLMRAPAPIGAFRHERWRRLKIRASAAARPSEDADRELSVCLYGIGVMSEG